MKPRVFTDRYNVEADLLDTPKGPLIVLSNWSGKPLPVKVTLDGREISAKVAEGAFIDPRGNP